MPEHAVSSNGGSRQRIETPVLPTVRLRSGPYTAVERPLRGEPGDWATLLHNLNHGGGGGSGRTRILDNGDTYLYVGIHVGSGDPDPFNVFNVTSPSKLDFKGGVETWTAANSVSAQQVPQFWPDEVPQFVGANTGKSQAPGSTGNGGVQVVDIGPSSGPYDIPLLGDIHAVSYGAFSGGNQTGLAIQWGERYYWGASFGLTNVWQLEGDHLNDLSLTGDTSESTWFGASEGLPPEFRRFMSNLGLVHHPLEPWFYDVGNSDYTLVWADYNEFTDFPFHVTTAPASGGVSGMFGLHDEPMLWGVGAVGSVGAQLTYVDVSDPMAPTFDANWVITPTGTLLGNPFIGMAQATYDHNKLLLTVRTGTSILDYAYVLYHLNIETREILNTWPLEVPPPITTPEGTFVTDGGAYYGWWDQNGVYLMDLGLAPPRTASSFLSNAERVFRK